MDAADYIAIVVGGLTLCGGVFGWLWHRLDKLREVLEVKNEVITAHEKTIDTQDRQILLLEATANATNKVLSTLTVVAQGGGKT